MLKWDEGALTNLILHEMAHGTVYFKRNTDLNEQMATFIGNQGAIGFLKEKYGSGSKEMLKAVEARRMISSSQDGSITPAATLDVLCPTRIERGKIEGREGVFLSLQEEFREMKSRFKTEMYQNFDQTPLNNAVLLAHRQYFHGFDTFERIHDYFHRDLSRVIALMKEIQASGEDPSVYLRPVDDRKRRYCFLFPAMNSSTMVLATSSGYWVGGCFIA